MANLTALAIEPNNEPNPVVKVALGKLLHQCKYRIPTAGTDGADVCPVLRAINHPIHLPLLACFDSLDGIGRY